MIVHVSSESADSDAWVVIFGCIAEMEGKYKVCPLIFNGHIQ